MNAKNSIERTQNRRVVITTPFPTPEELGAELCIPAARVAELTQMVDEILAQRERRRVISRRQPKRAIKAAKKK